MKKNRNPHPNLRTTDADVRNLDPALPVADQPPAGDEPLPAFRSGCPECGVLVLVTEQKNHGIRVCRCRECGWRGLMVG